MGRSHYLALVLTIAAGCAPGEIEQSFELEADPGPAGAHGVALPVRPEGVESAE